MTKTYLCSRCKELSGLSHVLLFGGFSDIASEVGLLCGPEVGLLCFNPVSLQGQELTKQPYLTVFRGVNPNLRCENMVERREFWSVEKTKLLLDKLSQGHIQAAVRNDAVF